MSKAFDLGQLIGDASKLSGGTIDNDRILLDVDEIPEITTSKITDLLSVINSNINDDSTFTITSTIGQYHFTGTGTSNDVNPNLFLVRGQTYYFDVNASGHPFWINSSNSTGQANAYSEGVTNNGTDSGVVEFTVQMDAPNTLYYNCEYHSAMSGTLNILGESGGATNADTLDGQDGTYYLDYTNFTNTPTNVATLDEASALSIALG